MTKLMTTGLMMMAISGCAANPAKATNFQGRVIEFKSGAEGFDTRTFFYEGEQEVVAFDAQFTPALAEQSIAHLRKFTKKPISWLVITHPNPDKFNGAEVFQRSGAKVIASAATAAAIPGVHAYKKAFFVKVAGMFQETGYPKEARVDQTFTGSTDLVLRGGERINLRELSQPGVSSTQTVAFVNSIQAVFVGDLVHHQAHAWLEGGIVNGKANPTINGWIADLSELSSLYPASALVYGGRGVTVTLEKGVNQQVDYLQNAVVLVRSELRKMGSHAADFNGSASASLYQELANTFQARFPGYQFSYLISYGAYGLVNSEM